MKAQRIKICGMQQTQYLEENLYISEKKDLKSMI